MSSENQEENKGGDDLAMQIQQLLEGMQGRFQQMSEGIIGKIDEMGGRIDELEESVTKLMDQAAVKTESSNTNENKNDENNNQEN